MAWRKTSRAALLGFVFWGQALSQSSPARYEAVEPHMGTLFRITLYAPDEAAAHSAFSSAFRRVAELDEILSDYEPGSELMRVCREAWRQPVPVSRDLFDVLSESQRVAGETGGAFDVTLGPVIRLWRQARQDRRAPEPNALREAAGRTGFRKLRLDPARRTVFLKQPDMLLDVGGIAKGYAADQALAVLRARGIASALVAASGDLAVGDPPPGRHGWRVGIDSLDRPGAAFTRILVLRNAAVSTSGDTEQFVEIGGLRYSHIIDPKTSLGLTAGVAVTVVSPRGMLSDSMATALSVMGAAPGLAFAQRRHMAALIVTPAGARATPAFLGLPRSDSAPHRER